MSDHHLFHLNLPRNKREFGVFLLIVSLISVNIIPVIITGLEVGFSLTTWAMVLRILPLLWVTVIATVLATMKPAEALARRLIHEADSYRAHLIANLLCSVLLMSVILTVVGTWIGVGHFTMAPLQHFGALWPRNFTIALIIEALVAQPVARFVMSRYHQRVDARQFEPIPDEELAAVATAIFS